MTTLRRSDLAMELGTTTRSKQTGGTSYGPKRTKAFGIDVKGTEEKVRTQLDKARLWAQQHGFLAARPTDLYHPKTGDRLEMGQSEDVYNSSKKSGRISLYRTGQRPPLTQSD